jgi:hypothetical protein
MSVVDGFERERSSDDNGRQRILRAPSLVHVTLRAGASTGAFRGQRQNAALARAIKRYPSPWMTSA